jgi:hypothetical protein
VNGHLGGLKSTAIEIDKHLAAGRLDDAQEAFSRMVNQYVNDAERPFRNAAYWALDTLYPAASRTEHGFGTLPRPCVADRTDPLPNPKPMKTKQPAKGAKAAKTPQNKPAS